MPEQLLGGAAGDILIQESAIESISREEQATVMLVQQTWADVLGVAAVAPDDDFFELGGHSLKAAATVARLGVRLGFSLPPLALFEAPTPAEMAELIEEVRTGRHHTSSGITPFFPDWVVPLQRQGSRCPVFVFPAGHNEITALAIEAQVAAHVGRDHPFWGFRRDDTALTAARATGVPAMAAAYVAQMRAIQGNGPYLLYANCAGGVYAWEAARQLLAAGDEIAGMLFFEIPLGPNAIASANDPLPWHVAASSPDNYRPAPLPVDLTLLMTGFWHERGWSEGWRQVALGSLETVVIPGETVTAFDRREERIARHVRDWIEQSEARHHSP